MLELIGTFVGNVLSLPGILGLGLGLLTRSPAVGAILGGLVGVFEALTFAGFSFAGLEGLETAMSVIVGVMFGSLGSAIRRKGATV